MKQTYISSGSHFRQSIRLLPEKDELERKKAIDIGNAMLTDGYKEEDLIPIATKQARE